MIVDDRLWFHSVIQTGDFTAISSSLTDTDVIVVSSEDSDFVYVFLYSIPKSVPLGRASDRVRQKMGNSAARKVYYAANYAIFLKLI